MKLFLKHKYREMNKYWALLFLFLSMTINSFATDKFVVVIDAGHGGKDGGATRKTMKEKDINLAVALQLGSLIESNVPDAKVIYTRKTDVFVSLIRRTEIANKAKANLFISIHTNSTEATTTSASGADTYILGIGKSEENLRVAKRENSVILLEDDYSQKYEGFDPSSPESYIIFEFMVNKYMDQSLDFATLVQQNFKSLAKRSDRGVRQAGFLVLKNTSMPSVLIELGFINNPTEAKYLTSRSGQRILANSIYAAFKGYKNDFDRKKGTARYEPKTPSKPERKEITQVTDSQKSKSNTVVSIKKEKKSLSERINSKSKEKQVEDSFDDVDDNVITISSEKKSEKNNTKKVETISSDQIEYRVQFLISSKELSPSSNLFKGLSPINFYKEGTTYKYTFGSTTSFNESIKLQREVRKKFPDAFVVKFKNGERF